jgi:hypothetical protein
LSGWPSETDSEVKRKSFAICSKLLEVVWRVANSAEPWRTL